MLGTAPKGIQTTLRLSATREFRVGVKRRLLHAPGRSFSRRSFIQRQDIANETVEGSASASNFGLRPADKQPWQHNDARFDESQPPRFGESKSEEKGGITSKEHGSNLETESREAKPLLLPQNASSTLEILNLLSSIKRAELRSWCSEFGVVSDISFPTRNPTYCRIQFDTVDAAVRAKESLIHRYIFSGYPAMRFAREGPPSSTKYLFIQNYKGTKEALEDAVSPFGNAIVHIVPTQLPGNQLRIDAFISFLTVEDSAKARVLLQNMSSGSNMAIRSVDASRYYAAISPGQDGPSMAEFLNNPEPKRSPPAPSEPTSTIWLGNIPVELLCNKDEIIQKFSKYGPLVDVRIPNEGTDKPRGYLYLEYHRQEDAEAVHQDLSNNPLFLFGRKVRVDYAASLSMVKANRIADLPQEQLSDRCLYVTGFAGHLLRDPAGLMNRLSSQFGDIVDLRIPKKDRVPTGVLFVDFTKPESAKAMIEAMKRKENTPLGPAAQVIYAKEENIPIWSNMDHTPTDTLRIWNLPARAILNDNMLYDAFGQNPGLIEVRIPKVDNFPWGAAFLQYSSIDAAKETLDWIRSDPDNPITFFGRQIRAHFTDNYSRKDRVRAQAEATGVPSEDIWSDRRGEGEDPMSAHRKAELRKWAWGLKPPESPRGEGSD